MYEERRERFSFKGLILQILVTLLFVLVLIWIFPVKNWVGKNINHYKSDTEVETNFDFAKISALSYQFFAENIVLMKDAAIKYFIKERLPKQKGDKETISLKQMYEKNIIYTLYDKEGNECNSIDSYVEIVNHEDEYELKVNLSCGNINDIIVVYLGIYDYCETFDICAKKNISDSLPENPTEPITPNSPDDSNNEIKPNNSENEETDNEISLPIDKLCEYKKVADGQWGDYSEWSEWSTQQTLKTNEIDVQTKVENVVVNYKTEKKKVGTKIETYIVGYDEEFYIKEYKTEKYQSGTKIEKYISRYITKKVAVTKKVQVGTTTKKVTKKVVAGTTRVYYYSDYGKKVPKNNDEYVYVKTGSTVSSDCSGCSSVTMYTWDVYKIVPVYKTKTIIEEVPVYATETVYETKKVPVYASKEVPVYSTRKVPVYETKQVPIYGTKKVDEYDYVKVAVYGDVNYYRYRTRKYIDGKTNIKWSACNPLDMSLINDGYYLTGNVK